MINFWKNPGIPLALKLSFFHFCRFFYNLSRAENFTFSKSHCQKGSWKYFRFLLAVFQGFLKIFHVKRTPSGHRKKMKALITGICFYITFLRKSENVKMKLSCYWVTIFYRYRMSRRAVINRKEGNKCVFIALQEQDRSGLDLEDTVCHK